MFRPQDILVVLKLAVAGGLSYAELASSTGLSASQAHQAVKRASAAQLVDPKTKSVRPAALLEFLVHGLKYVFPAQRGPLVRGTPTAHAARPLSLEFSDESPLVWPDPEGAVRGESLQPIHKGAVHAARLDPELYELLALVDAIRAGRARERRRAVELLTERLVGDL